MIILVSDSHFIVVSIYSKYFMNSTAFRVIGIMSNKETFYFSGAIKISIH